MIDNIIELLKQEQWMSALPDLLGLTTTCSGAPRDAIIEIIERRSVIKGDNRLNIAVGYVFSPDFLAAPRGTDPLIEQIKSAMEAADLYFVLKNKFWKLTTLVEYQVEIIGEDHVF
ncbi:MAG TPA: hypothetical protein VKZ57_02705 [Sphingobacterium sp.]|nr:hypothetical protein [Sphingobacterium sp.]